MLHLVDSHCHLDFPQLAGENRAVILQTAKAAGVHTMLTISTRIRRFAEIAAAVENNEGIDIYCTLGTHPHQAAEEADIKAEDIIEMATHPQLIGLGETGLDYFYDQSPRDVQQRCFREHLKASRALGLPVIVHSRDAEEDTIRLLEEAAAGQAPYPLTGLIHCFSGSKEFAEAAVKLGFYISFSGIVTFPKSSLLREISASLPLERLLVETDSPYLAPVPHRGQTNQPAYVAHSCRILAEARAISMEAMAATTTANFFRLFSKAKQS
ncbi:MAG: TatD family hydrolase [Alphaproteobacteria bacterium]